MALHLTMYINLLKIDNNLRITNIIAPQKIKIMYLLMLIYLIQEHIL